LVLPLLPLAVAGPGVPLVAALSIAGIVYGALCALGQTDMKRLVAYSSVSHLGFCMLGLFALNSEGIAGGTLQMINHGLSTGALFLLVGMLYERLHTRQLTEMGGLASRLPIFSCFLVFVALFGPRREYSDHHELRDLNTREVCALAPIAVLCLAIGVFPHYFLDVMRPEVDAIAAIYAKGSPKP
jgi:NADH-quinone oxidoreductase subunit M